ncbi:MAG: rRNA methyltransferase [Treponema sp.]|jgi:hypothetical protein|nr:rRNA methyltransferase [Treponema sp.]
MNDILESIPKIISRTFPIPGKYRSALPSKIAELSRLLTNKRGGRSLSYLNRPEYLSAYLNYYLPWNLYRLCLLLPSLEIKLNSGNVIVDLGSGPLTFVLALWISRPDLRNIPLEFNCIDRSAQALEAGKKLFAAICEETRFNSPWKINLLREDFDIRKPFSFNRKKASLVCAVNLFNEAYEKLPHTNTAGLKHTAANAARFMNSLALDDAFLLTVEPGIPQSGKFISFLRAAFMELNRMPLSPCAHTEICPLSSASSAKKRWCHFAFENFNAPKELVRLSAAAKLPKERLVLSYLLTGPLAANASLEMRVISDAFPLPGYLYGRYACSEKGLVLLTGEKHRIEKEVSGTLVKHAPLITTKMLENTDTDGDDTAERDAKSGALIVHLPGSLAANAIPANAKKPRVQTPSGKKQRNKKSGKEKK